MKQFKFNIPIRKIDKDLKNKENQLNFEEKIQILKEEKTTTEKNIIKSNNLETGNKAKVEEIIDPKKVREDYEKIIQEKMKEIKGNYTESEKRDMVLMGLKTTTNYLDIKQGNDDKIDIEKIKENEEIKIYKKIEKIDNNNENYYEKRLFVLNEMSTKKNYMNKEDIKQSTNQQKQIESLNEKSKNLDTPSCTNTADYSTFQDSKEAKAQIPETDDLFKTVKSKIFNEARAQIHIKYKIFDDLLTNKNSDLIFPEKYNVDFTHYVFVYENNYKTYPIICNETFKHEKDIKFNNLEEPLGLHFCGKKVKLKGEIEIKECAPDNFICKECMEKNKKRYNLPDNYLININGRVSKNIKGRYHCIGTFGKGKSFEYCVNNFTCKACEILNSCQNYYFE